MTINLEGFEIIPVIESEVPSDNRTSRIAISLKNRIIDDKRIVGILITKEIWNKDVLQKLTIKVFSTFEVKTNDNHYFDNPREDNSLKFYVFLTQIAIKNMIVELNSHTPNTPFENYNIIPMSNEKVFEIIKNITQF